MSKKSLNTAVHMPWQTNGYKKNVCYNTAQRKLVRALALKVSHYRKKHNVIDFFL